MFKVLRIALLSLGAFFATAALAQPAPDGYSDQGEQADPPSRVARLAFIRGAVSFVPAGENDWAEAQLNRPLITGDKLWTDRGSRAELEIGSAAVRIDEQTSFDFLNLDDQTAQVELTQGALNLRVRRLYDNQVYEIDTPTLAFVINRVGEYRISVTPNGDATIVTVVQGGGDAYGEDGARFRVEEGQSVTFNDSQLRDYYTDSLPPPDDFDQFIIQRNGRWDHATSRQYVSEDVIGYQDLDDNGEWSDVPEYGHVWYPTSVEVGWAPYHRGHWGWVGSYGWTWIDDASWGFAPFHYGRWAYIGNRWGWCPGPISVRPYYAPALVAFVGGGVSIGIGGGGPVGWFPLGPRDVYFPGYRVSRGYFTRVNVSNTVVNTTIINNYYGNYSRGSVDYGRINYANRNISGAVIAVPATAFVSARPVHTAAVTVNRETFANARVSSFAAIAPTRASLVAAPNAGRTAVAPPAAVANRRIVAASKPPAPVASFASREAVLQKNPGQPLNQRQMRATPGAGPNAQAGQGARNAAADRGNVKVVTNTGVPAKTAAPPLVQRGGNPNARGADRGRDERGPGRANDNVQRDNAQRAGQPQGANAQQNVQTPNANREAGRGGRPPANDPGRNERVPSSNFVRGNQDNPNRAGNAVDNGNAGNRPNERERNPNAGQGRQPNESAQGQNARQADDNGRGNNARTGRDQQQGDRAQQQRQEQLQAERAQQQQQQNERAQQQRQQQNERGQQQRQEQQQTERAQQQRQQEQQNERVQQQRQQQMQNERAQQQQQNERAQQERQQQMQNERAQQQRQQQMQAERAQQAQQQQNERAQQQRQQQMQAERAQQQQQQQQQRAQPQPPQQKQPPEHQNDRKRNKKDDDKDNGGGR